MTKLQKKIIRYSLLILSIALLLLIIILTPCMTEIVWYGKNKNDYATEICLMVLIPFLSSMLSYLISEKFITKSLNDAKNKLEWLYDNNFVDIEKYIELLKYLDEADEKKRNAKLQARIKKEIAIINSKKEAEQKIMEAKEQVEQELNNTTKSNNELIAIKDNKQEIKKNNENSYNYV